MNDSVTKFVRRACFALCLAGFTALAIAQSNYPNRATRFLVGNSTGSTPDIVARLFGDMVSRRLGQAWAVENRPGADGLIAAEATAKSDR